CSFFFFQAEDGIRDFHVTGVQTCALPILLCVHGLSRNANDFDEVAKAMSAEYRVVCPDIVGRGASDFLPNPASYAVPQYVSDIRSEERRVGKEGWSRVWGGYYKKKRDVAE